VQPADVPAWDSLAAAHAELAAQIAAPAWLARAGKSELTARFADLVPSFTHLEAGANLDRLV